MPSIADEVVFDVRRFGAAGDGRTIDTASINKAIEAANRGGGGIVFFPAGTYACFTIRLKDQVALYIGPGATILAAPTPYEGMASGGFDAAEPNGPWEDYQDFGHNHWRNSLIVGEGLHDLAIMGPGRIYGLGLSRGHSDPDLPRAEAPGVGNKAIALKDCQNVILRDFSILDGGHIGILATGVDNLVIDNLTIDTNRDGVDIDCCRNVRVANCTVNSPFDDGICLKSSYALGYARTTDNVTISNCYVTGDYNVGTLLNGTRKRRGVGADGLVWGRTGRIKCGTESNGGFRNIAIANCVFEGCRGFALETVDGGVLEDVTFTGVVMRDIGNAPFFFRLGRRLRGPAGTPVGSFKRVIVSNITCTCSSAATPSLLAGAPGHPIEDIKISDVFLAQPGGGTAAMVAARPQEQADGYPEPGSFGALPACGLYVRHARNLELSNVEIALSNPDPRPVCWLEDVSGFDAFRLKSPRNRTAPAFQLKQVSDFRVFGCPGLPDGRISRAEDRSI
jgi:polygalacturonase